MSYEIDYIPVGEGTHAGDAIALRYGNLSINAQRNEYTVIVIDGGTKTSGQELVNHIIEHYHTNKVDYVFSTHLDRDHLSGLTIILDQLEVSTLYMHVPWEHLDETNPLFVGDFTDTELEQRLKESLDLVHEVEQLAIEKGIGIEEPFAGTTIDGKMLILSPTKEYYEQLLCQFRQTPQAKSALEEILGTIRKAAESAVTWIEDKMDSDLLNDNETTSAENSSSVILLMILDGHKLLFTGDAGIQSLTIAADYSEGLGLGLLDLKFLHIPHHGSKHNLGSSTVKRLKAKYAFVSGAKEGIKHPSKKITNAVKKQKVDDINTKVIVVRDKPTRHHFNAPAREGWTTAEEEPFHNQVEE